MTTMRPTTSPASRAVPALLAAVVASIVLGIVGMHALSAHGITGMDMGTTDRSAMTEAHGDMSANTATSETGGLPALVTASVPAGGKGHMVDMVMLCIAMLAAAAGALLALLLGLRRRTRVWAHAPTVPATVTRWVSARLGTGPPYVWQFSVIRC